MKLTHKKWLVIQKDADKNKKNNNNNNKTKPQR